MKPSLIMLSMVCLALVGAASGAVEKGDVMVEFMGGWTMQNGESGSNLDAFAEGATGTDFNSWIVSGGLSRFLSDRFQLGLTGFYTDLGGDTETLTILPDSVAEADVDVTAFGIGGKGRFHLNPEDDWVWYVGGQALWVSADVDVTASVRALGEVLLPEATVSDSVSGIQWGPVVGLRAQLTETNELLFEYQFLLYTGDISDVITDGHAFFVGLSHRFE